MLNEVQCKLLGRDHGQDHLTMNRTGGGGAMGLNVATSILESGGDVICIDRMEKPLPELWGTLHLTSKFQIPLHLY